VNLSLECDLAPAGRSDEIDDTINYVTIKDGIVRLAESNEFFLIERLATEIGRLCLEDPRVQAVTVCVDKPEALTGAGSVAVEMRFDRERMPL
jgi:FolB domain-containing protein